MQEYKVKPGVGRLLDAVGLTQLLGQASSESPPSNLSQPSLQLKSYVQKFHNNREKIMEDTRGWFLLILHEH